MDALSVTPYINVARVTRTHGRNGEVVVVPQDGLPFSLREDMRVWLTPPPLRGDHERRVVKLREYGEGDIIAFSGIKTMDDAEEIVGNLVLALRSDVPEIVEEQLYRSLDGRRVADVQRGYVGTVVEVLELPANDVWRLEGGPFGEILMPVIDDVIVDVPEQGDVLVALLPGLIDPSVDPVASVASSDADVQDADAEQYGGAHS